MAKYVFKYLFEYGGTCLWADNDEARRKFDCAVDNSELPISNSLINELYALEKEFQGSLDWDYPPDPSPWTEQQWADFRERAYEAYLRLLAELGSEYDVVWLMDREVK